MTASTTITDPSVAYRLLQRMVIEGFATGNVDVVDDLCAPDMVEHQSCLAGTGAEAITQVKEAIRQVHAAAPDMRFEIEDAVESGDTIWARVQAHGTATGPFFGPPSGRPVHITVIDIARVVDGRIVEHWGVPERFALLAQTGVLDRLSPPRPSSDDEH
jgi:predicted ester cyclase